MAKSKEWTGLVLKDVSALVYYDSIDANQLIFKTKPNFRNTIMSYVKNEILVYM